MENSLSVNNIIISPSINLIWSFLLMTEGKVLKYVVGRKSSKVWSSYNIIVVVRINLWYNISENDIFLKDYIFWHQVWIKILFLRIKKNWNTYRNISLAKLLIKTEQIFWYKIFEDDNTNSYCWGNGCFVGHGFLHILGAKTRVIGKQLRNKSDGGPQKWWSAAHSWHLWPWFPSE